LEKARKGLYFQTVFIDHNIIKRYNTKPPEITASELGRVGQLSSAVKGHPIFGRVVNFRSGLLRDRYIT